MAFWWVFLNEYKRIVFSWIFFEEYKVIVSSLICLFNRNKVFWSYLIFLLNMKYPYSHKNKFMKINGVLNGLLYRIDVGFIHTYLLMLKSETTDANN